MTLSSCYFCGTAIEEPLSEYPVVPDALSPAPDEQVTVVLCPSCHRKLSTVLDRVAAAADRQQRTLDDAGAAGVTPASGGSGESEDDDAGEDAGTEASDAGVDAAQSAGEAATDRSGDDPLGGATAADAGGAAPADPDDSAIGDRSADADTPAADDALATGSTADTAEDPSGITVEQPDRPGTDESRRDDGDAGGTGDGTGEDDTGSGTDGWSTGGSSDGGKSSDDGRASPAGASDAPSQATYNRVVRLLQNREFPVERDEIATVAMNAYDIPPEDFDAVIQTAVNRGVLAEEGPYLKKAD
ncbi:hypothetical protein [Halostella litorea]|uniref:hypothetical protein n=1 Tax=Halostella litorea TaxID=2528831 RepID=UPI00138706BC|nr:hypothetical protein [Halostella litorea]